MPRGISAARGPGESQVPSCVSREALAHSHPSVSKSFSGLRHAGPVTKIRGTVSLEHPSELTADPCAIQTLLETAPYIRVLLPR